MVPTVAGLLVYLHQEYLQLVLVPVLRCTEKAAIACCGYDTENLFFVSVLFTCHPNTGLVILGLWVLQQFVNTS